MNCFILKRFEMSKQINKSFRSMNDENKNCSHNISYRPYVAYDIYFVTPIYHYRLISSK